MRSKLLFVAAMLACIWTSEARLRACSCYGPIPACQATWQAHAVFVAKVLAVVDEPRPAKPDPSALHYFRRVSLDVTEVFRGEVPKSLPLYTGQGGGDCGYEFSVGESYLIYAHRVPTGELTTGICSRTKPTTAAGDDLEYLRGAATKPSGLGSIQGVVRYPDPRQQYVPFDRAAPYPAGKITIVAADPGKNARYEAVTDLEGKYAVKVPVGKYTATLSVRDGLYATGGLMRPEILDGRGCAEVNFVVRPDGRIGGRVVTTGGRLVLGLSVEILTAAESANSYFSASERGRTDASGAFEFSRLAPGSYMLGLTLNQNVRENKFNAIWFKESAGTSPMRVAMEPEQRVWLGDLQLPDSVKLSSIDGIVTLPDGASATGTKVYVLTSPSFGIAAGPIDVDANGRFSFTVIAGRTYKMSAELQATPGVGMLRKAESQQFLAEEGNVATFRLQIGKN